MTADIPPATKGIDLESEAQPEKTSEGAVLVDGTLAYHIEISLEKIGAGGGVQTFLNGDAPRLFSNPDDDARFTNLLQGQGSHNEHK